MAAIRDLGEVLRYSPDEGCVHPQYFPTIMGIARRVSGNTMEKMVRGEVERFMARESIAEEYGGRGITGKEDLFYLGFTVYSNNFWAKIDPKLPGGYQRMWLEAQERLLDTPLGPDIRAARAKAKDNPKVYHPVPKTVAERRTLRQFIGDINRAVEESGTSLDEYRNIVFDEHSRTPQNSAKLGRLLYPAYVKLREWGYAHDDLD